MRKREWTAGQDDCIRVMRSVGATWQQIADVLKVPHQAVIDRGRAVLRAERGSVPREAEVAAEVRERGPLPAGHPVSWGILTRGTMLEGTKWPL